MLPLHHSKSEKHRDMKNLIKKYTTEQGQIGLWFVDPKMASLTESIAVFMARTTGNEFVVDGNTIRKV